ncbi:hypothetical protein GCM10009609_18870 [Pseudonocardia aurantiaca]|uniref:Uncharacterized protein n=1 Tax=Pseudonocardia aurantiaca TaxID=75290 RepID=A0ABW4FMP8_9PSEU
MAGKPRSTEPPGRPGAGGEAQPQTSGEAQNQGGGTLTQDVGPSSPAEGSAEGRRSATLNLPFMTAQFRAPELHMPGRDDLSGAARGVQSLLPSKGAALFYGGLAVTAVIGAIEWPVAAAIGVGTALASKGAANPEPRGGSESVPAQAETRAEPAGSGTTT